MVAWSGGVMPLSVVGGVGWLSLVVEAALADDVPVSVVPVELVPHATTETEATAARPRCA